MTHLSRQPLAVDALRAAVSDPSRGAVAIFVGDVRNHHGGRAVLRLEYSAYEPMAEKECRAIVDEAERRWPVSVALAHRLGVLEVGEAAVVVTASASHRGDAFESCRWVIDEVKRRVPIWKREYYADGTVAWVDPTASAGAVAAGREAQP